MNLTRKINIAKPTTWSHHRSGWRYAVEALQSLHDPLGITFYDWADAVFRDKLQLKDRWIGIFHNAINYPQEYTHKYGKGIHCLSALTNCPTWEQNMKSCKGLFTLSQHTANFLRTITNVPVTPLIHPVQDCYIKFDVRKFNSRVVTLGQWLRRYHSIYQLETTWKKIVVKTGKWWSQDYAEMKQRGTGDVSVWEYVNDVEYDNILSNSVVFLDLYDCAACNVVLECIMRNTPILVNRHPATEEYLGADYPLLFDDLNQASSFLNTRHITEASEFLRQKDKRFFHNMSFRDDLINSPIYSNLQTRNQIMYE